MQYNTCVFSRKKRAGVVSFFFLCVCVCVSLLSLVDPHDVDRLRLAQRPQLPVVAHPVAHPVGGHLAHHAIVQGHGLKGQGWGERALARSS